MALLSYSMSEWPSFVRVTLGVTVHALMEFQSYGAYEKLDMNLVMLAVKWSGKVLALIQFGWSGAYEKQDTGLT